MSLTFISKGYSLRDLNAIKRVNFFWDVYVSMCVFVRACVLAFCPRPLSTPTFPAN